MEILHGLFFLGLFCIVTAQTVKPGQKCEDTQCASYQTCEDDDAGATCYNSSLKVDCGIFYCYKPRQCCGVNSCCPEKSKCCGAGVCCEEDATCCGLNTCCPPRSICCSVNICCEEGGACCGLSCCRRGAYCDGGICRRKRLHNMKWYYMVPVIVIIFLTLVFVYWRRKKAAQRREAGLVAGTVLSVPVSVSQPDHNYGYEQPTPLNQYEQMPAYPAAYPSATPPAPANQGPPKLPAYHEVVNPTA